MSSAIYEAIAVSVASSVLSDVIGDKVSGLIGGKPKAPGIPSLSEPKEIPAAGSGSVDSIAAANARRRKTQQLSARSGAQSTVLTDAAAGGSLGAG